ILYTSSNLRQASFRYVLSSPKSVNIKAFVVLLCSIADTRHYRRAIVINLIGISCYDWSLKEVSSSISTSKYKLSPCVFFFLNQKGTTQQHVWQITARGK